MSASPTPRAFADKLLTLPEVAGLLRVSERTVLRLTEAGDLPGGKIAGQWRFSSNAVDTWLTDKVGGRTGTAPPEEFTPATEPLDLPALLPPERLLCDLRPGRKETVLRQLVAPLWQARQVRDADRYVQLLLARETLHSTAVGEGVALPHVRAPAEAGLLAPCLVLGVSREGIDFDAVDGAPTHLFVLVGSPTIALHLRLLARVSALLRRPGLVAELTQARSPGELHGLLSTAIERSAPG